VGFPEHGKELEISIMCNKFLDYLAKKRIPPLEVIVCALHAFVPQFCMFCRSTHLALDVLILIVFIEEHKL
jgi:hypothetical protein